VDERFRNNLKDRNYTLAEVDIGDITFQAGQQESAHRWYRLTPSFAPSLVRFFLAEFGVSRDALVFDPFCGRGTTILECQKQGIRGLGLEINPLLHTVGALSLQWQPQQSTLFADFLNGLTAQTRRERRRPLPAVLRARGLALPDIHDVYRWWQEDVLRDLLIARQLVHAPAYVPILHYLWLAVNAAALECANIHRNHPTITFDDDHDRVIDVSQTVAARVGDIVADLRELPVAHSGLGRIVRHNSCSPLGPALEEGAQITHAISSPPYPNRFSYIHQTRPQLHFMELLRNRAEATEIDLVTIGGTWGRATSNLSREPIEPPSPLRSLLSFRNELGARSLLMCNYATKYFLDLDTHIAELRRVVRSGFHGAYVVGNSRLAGVDIYTEAILAQLFERHGFQVERLLLFRKRGGRRRLYETAVCVTL
jgi:hypothetical protein